MATVSVRLGRIDKIYNTGVRGKLSESCQLGDKSALCFSPSQEAVTGVVRIDAAKSYKHAGVKCRAVGRMLMHPNKGSTREIIIMDVRVPFPSPTLYSASCPKLSLAATTARS
jgi:hypothetical protein